MKDKSIVCDIFFEMRIRHIFRCLMTDKITRRGAIGGLAASATGAFTQAGVDQQFAVIASATSNFFGVARYANTAAAIKAGELSTALGTLFSVDDGLGNLFYRERTLDGSIEVAATITPTSLAEPNAAQRIGTLHGSLDTALRQKITIIPLFKDAASIVIPDGIDHVQTIGHSVIGIGTGRYVYDRLVDKAYVAENYLSSFISDNKRGFRLAEEINYPEMFGAGNSNEFSDTLAFRYMIARDYHIQLKARAVYLINGDCTIDHPSKYHWGVKIRGIPGNPSGELPKIRVMRPGITPFPVAQHSYIEGVDIGFDKMGTLPPKFNPSTLQNDTWPYPRALEIAGSISTVVRNRTIGDGNTKAVETLTLTVPAGGLIDNVSRGSAVVVLGDRSKHQDYWIQNFKRHDHIYQIEEILSDTQCTLQGKVGDSYPPGTLMHIRGNCMSVIYMQHQPTKILLRSCALSAPGCGMMSMGAQFLSQSDCFNGLGNCGPALFMHYSGNGNGYFGQRHVFAQQGETTGGEYHECEYIHNVGFHLSGGVFINGWNEGVLIRSQIDQSHSVNEAIASFTRHYNAIYNIYNANNFKFHLNSAEDTRSPSGAYFFQCSNLDVNQMAGFDILDTGLAEEGFMITFEACASTTYKNLRNAGGLSNYFKDVRFLGQGESADFEVVREGGGRKGHGAHVYNEGRFGDFVQGLDERDCRIIAFEISREVISSTNACHCNISLDLSKYTSYAGFAGWRVDIVGFQHGGSWSTTDGTPTVSAGISSISETSYFPEIDLSHPRGFYLIDSNWLQAQRGALFTSSAPPIVLTFRTGGATPWSMSSNVSHDCVIYIKVIGARSAQ